MAAATAAGANRGNRRLTFVRWVRKTHGWFGLWGALLGLMFGLSGIWLGEHRDEHAALVRPSSPYLRADVEQHEMRKGDRAAGRIAKTTRRRFDSYRNIEAQGRSSTAGGSDIRITLEFLEAGVGIEPAYTALQAVFILVFTRRCE